MPELFTPLWANFGERWLYFAAIAVEILAVVAMTLLLVRRAGMRSKAVRWTMSVLAAVVLMIVLNGMINAIVLMRIADGYR